MDTEKMVISQKKLKVLLGGLGISIPTLVYLGNLWIFGVSDVLPSLSSYYYSDLRDIFVGVFFSIGIFLIAYEGYDTGDRILSTLAGLSCIGLAILPTAPTGEEPTLLNMIHLISAALFLLFGAIFSMRFTKTSPEVRVTFKKRIRNLIYWLCAVFALASLILLIVTELGIIDKFIENSTFWLEYIGINAFGTAWLIKGEAVFFLNDDSILKMNPWEISGLIVLVLLALGSFTMLSLIFFS
ncbi:MAG: DUF998 domain-containing protein [Candidatus Kariarchaeaceae archaeon]|jgi:hypothetical protein